MNKVISNFIYIKFSTACSYISFLIPITSDYSINRSYHHITTKVKFSSIIKKRSIYILLNYISFKFAILMSCFTRKYSFDIRKRITNIYSISSISNLSRFNNPNVSQFFYFPPTLWIVIRINHFFLFLYICFSL